MYKEFFPRRLAKLRTLKGISARDMSLSIGQNPGYINACDRKWESLSDHGQFFLYL